MGKIGATVIVASAFLMTACTISSSKDAGVGLERIERLKMEVKADIYSS